ncbi:transglutaminase domain-containing protein [Fulvivirga sp. 29W222]|uniref:Transglutaminase domain-containing protein n=1 Tax=Fulvivirga marina TaxID=2494733 RepID=A0A937FY15_9BACT|nr:transglutaminase-like domain-containing protein [Fulvivirga marina]MBL6448239.1 transglutaminase domain-containing protein [Fulvivirga marina]
MKKYLERTPILDYDHALIQGLVAKRGWHNLEDEKKIESIYNFVRDEIPFGYNIDDNISASSVLKDGYGQCNTKSNLFMALLRAVGIPNRIHGFTIDKALQKGAITGVWYVLSPKNILHSWVEVYYKGNWYNLEGIILDKPYLSALQQKFSDCKTTFCGYGAYTDNFENPQIDWNLNNTYIQDKGINQDFGVFDSPDDFFKKHQQKLNLVKRWLFRNYIRHQMNRNVSEIRMAGIHSNQSLESKLLMNLEGKSR